MAMRKQLWSLSALSVELGRDRRTMAKILDGIAPDGQINGHDAWHLQTALAAVRAFDDPAPSAGRGNGGNGLVENIKHRLASWKTIHAEEPPALPIEVVAEMMDVRASTILTWLRAGLPYRTPGCWKSGSGFEMHLAWTTEWVAAIQGIVERSGDADLSRQLGL